MAKKPPDAPPAKVALYEKLIATNPAVQCKGAANLYTSRNGHMFSQLSKDGLMLRLPADVQDAFIKRYRTKIPVRYGAVMKEYVEVPASLLKKTRELKTYFDISYDYIGTLKPKPTTRKKTTGKTKKKVAKKKR